MKKIITAAVLIALVCVIYQIDTITATSHPEQRTQEEVIMKSKNHDGETFINSVPTLISKEGTLFDTIWKWITGNEEREPASPLGQFALDPAEFNSLPESGLRITWMGHSSVLIEIDGKRFITDPVWSKRVSPISIIGPARFFKPVITIDKLPHLDGVIISHDHYDHLDETAVKELSRRDIDFYIPLGVSKYLQKWGVNRSKIHELDWWDTVKIGQNHTLAATPARHFSGRSLFKRNRTLWASWVILGEKHRVYFGGDSGYFPGFKAIGEKYGPFDITMLEIGAYHPNWGTIHLGPENAAKAHLDLKGKVLLPIHWGTFTLAMHGWTEPIEDLLTISKNNNIKLLVPQPGQPMQSPYLTYNSKWWERGRIANSNKLAEEMN